MTSTSAKAERRVRLCVLCNGRKSWQLGDEITALCPCCHGTGELPPDMSDTAVRAWQHVRARTLDAHNHWREEA